VIARDSLILRATTRLLFPLTLVFSIFLLVRGHNEPGGGFVGGLAAASAFALVLASDGLEKARRLLRRWGVPDGAGGGGDHHLRAGRGGAVTVVLAVVIGLLYAAGLYLVMRRSMVKLILGLALLAHAANLLIFTVGGLSRGGTPIVPPGRAGLAAPFPDPVPQALVLTAIVIGFAVQAFALVLVKRAHRETGTDDLDSLRSTDTRP
jgi:multicomponent Na+:H+ antiporter subunit C